MNFNMDYETSIIIGLFLGSVILFMGRILSYPITGTLLAIICSALFASFLYNPSNKKNPKHRALRGATSSFLLCFIFSIILTIYYVPRFSSVLGTADLSISLSIGIILLFTIIGGIVIGSLGGSIGSTFRDLVSVITFERK
ncbi:DUF5518 domain-containing protein [uncultured Methanosphaera sp.]|jgi:hypothetical protein|uniref:DUF5518 domain-containing protein n=2 Tax=Methanosphaera TaxID=2316 RepID=UPI0025E0B3B9|nr:DUF5518 domain-containing protein [uncultured Methanosphaera sp.]MDD6286588.1 DUF5518 domain-containing protein [Methanobacteriaceae archaeon]MDY2744554.1 DUF5518 domain-containing protein [Methanosphaera sp.]